MNYIQGTASSSLCLGIKRNNEGQAKRPYINDSYKEYGLDLECMVAPIHYGIFSNKKDGSRTGWEDWSGGSSHIAYNRHQGAEAIATKLGEAH